MLQFVEGLFDRVALPVEFPVIVTSILPVRFGRYDRFGTEEEPFTKDM